MRDQQEHAQHPHPEGSVEAHIADIISEFSAVFATARTNWAKYAETVHPDLSGGGLMVLQAILRNGPITATEICQRLNMDKALVSRQISRLRDFSLVEATPAADDRRVQLLSGTALAVETMADVRGRWAHSYHERFEGWSAEELAEFSQTLHRFNATPPQHTDGPAARCARDHREAPGAGGSSSQNEPDEPAGPVGSVS